VFSHGWPLSADDWDNQMLFFLQQGYRVIAHDRRGHGRSTQTVDGHDMDHYADDLAAVVQHLDLLEAIHVGHSTGGGEVAHYLARYGESRAAKAAQLCAVPPLMVKTDANPDGLPKDVFDDLQAQLAANRSVFYRALPSGPFYGFNRPGVVPSETSPTACRPSRPTSSTPTCSTSSGPSTQPVRTPRHSRACRLILALEAHHWRNREAS
jgi:non-heme chloroperoxidase